MQYLHLTDREADKERMPHLNSHQTSSQCNTERHDSTMMEWHLCDGDAAGLEGRDAGRGNGARVIGVHDALPLQPLYALPRRLLGILLQHASPQLRQAHNRNTQALLRRMRHRMSRLTCACRSVAVVGPSRDAREHLLGVPTASGLIIVIIEGAAAFRAKAGAAQAAASAVFGGGPPSRQGPPASR